VPARGAILDHRLSAALATAFFLIVVNIVYAFFDTFGVIHAITRGGPNYATNILVYKVFNDGFINLDLGGSAASRWS